MTDKMCTNFLIEVKNYIIMIEVSRGAGAQSATVNAAGCGFEPHTSFQSGVGFLCLPCCMWYKRFDKKMDKYLSNKSKF